MHAYALNIPGHPLRRPGDEASTRYTNEQAACGSVSQTFGFCSNNTIGCLLSDARKNSFNHQIQPLGRGVGGVLISYRQE
jgi:hypothetical protein